MSKVLKRPLLLIPLLLLFPLTAKSQTAVRYLSQVITTSGRPLAGATIAICNQPASFAQQPCSPLATIYTDPSRSTHATNPIHSDGLGNYEFYADPGTYSVQIYGQGITEEDFVDVPVPCLPFTTCGAGATVVLQTNEVSNPNQALLDCQNATENPAGKRVSCINPSGGIWHMVLSNVAPSTGGSALIGDISNLQTNQVICSDSSVHLTNCTPAIIPINDGTTGRTFLATDRGHIIDRSNAGAMTDTIAQAGTTGFETGYHLGIRVPNSSGVVSLTSTTSHFLITNGSTFTNSTTLTVNPGQYAYLYDNGTDYEVNLSASANAEKTCMMQFGSDGAQSALATTDYFPQMSVCFVKAAGVVDTVIVMADSGASTVRVGFDVNGTYTQISPTLTPATVSGIADKVACANTGGTAITIKGTSVTCSVLSSTSIAAGQYFEPSAGTADGTTKRLSIAVTWQ